MSSSRPVSIIHPTIHRVPSCETLLDQMEGADELLVVCDSTEDPVYEWATSLPDSVRVVVAGEPMGCSGKANAIAAGLEAAENDLIVLTDDDFHHPEGWLSQMKLDYEQYGPTSECPFFTGQDWLSVVMEPLYTLASPLGIHILGAPWGGAVIFSKDDIEYGEYNTRLRQTISDDALLSEYLHVHSARRTRVIDTGDDIRETLERHARFVQTVANHVPFGAFVLSFFALLLTTIHVVIPMVAAPSVTLVMAGIYRYFGISRWTALIAYPAMLLVIPLVAYGLLRDTFVWSGRRYQWNKKFDVDIIDPS